MNIEDGIAVNLALKENVFAIIPCVMNKIPILICGKPGSSKSMAI
jgi:E3 ubiquitin-protein ligase RNF213